MRGCVNRLLPALCLALVGAAACSESGSSGGGSADNLPEKYRINETSERFGFIAVFPEGTSNLLGKHHWNAGNCDGIIGLDCGGPAYSRKADDVGYIARVLDEIEQRFPVDPERFFAAGMANGCTDGPAEVERLGDVVCEAWTGCRDDRQVRLCRLEPSAGRENLGGHSWPGGVLPSRCDPDQTECPCSPTPDVDAAVYLWEFFSR